MQNLFNALAPGGSGWIDIQINFQKDEGDGCMNWPGPFALPSEESLCEEEKITIIEDGSVEMTSGYQKEVMANIEEFMQQFNFSQVIIGCLEQNPFNIESYGEDDNSDKSWC